MMISYNDVTEREKAFQRIKENESKLFASQKIAKVGYWQSFPGSKELYSSTELDITMSYQHHANCFITKPIDATDFLNAISKIKDFWINIVQLPK